MMFCAIIGIAQLIVAFSTTFLPLALGMGLFGCGFAAYAGFKMVTTTEVFGYNSLSAFIMIDQLLCIVPSFVYTNLLIRLCESINDVALIFKIGAVNCFVCVGLAFSISKTMKSRKK